MYFSKDADSVPTFESPWIHQGWTPAKNKETIRATIQIYYLTLYKDIHNSFGHLVYWDL